MTGSGGMSGAPGMFHSQGWYANRPGLANPYAGQIGATSPGGGGLIPRPGGTMPPSGGVGAGGTTGGPGVGSMGQAMPGPGQTGALGGGGIAANAGNSGIGPLLQLLMGGGGSGGQLGGLLQQLMGNPMYGQHSAGWLANRQDPNWLAQHPNAVGIGGTPIPRPGGTPPMLPNQPTMTPGFNVNTLSRPGGPGGVNQGAVGAPPTGAGQDFANAGIYMGSPIVNALTGGMQGWNGPGGVNQGASGAPTGGAIPRPGTTTASNNQMQQNDAQAQAMQTAAGMQNSPNPMLQAIAPLLMQQLLAR